MSEEIKISVITPTIRGKEGLERPKKGLDAQTFTGFEWITDEHDPALGSNLNQSLNEMVRIAKGELIVFLQDFIEINPEGLQMFWDAYQYYDRSVFTAPVGKLTEEIKWDWRKHKEDPLSFQEWEIDWGAAPKKLLEEVGGFDEELDKYWGFDNVNIALRLQMKEVSFRNLKDNTSVALDHDKILEHPFRKLRNPDFHNQRLEDFRHGLTIKYL